LWFYDRLVRPEPLVEAAEALVHGSLAHEVLDALFTHMREKHGQLRVEPGTLGTWLDAARRLSAELVSGRLDADRLRDRLIARSVEQMVVRLVQRDAEYLPGYETVYTEWSFGLDDAPEDFGAFELKGRVDRIDRRGADLVIIDYKSGSGAVPVARFEADGVLQAPLYAAVAARRLGGRVVGSFYRSLGARRRTELNRGVYLSDSVSGSELVSKDATDDLEPIIGDAVKRADRAAEGIRAGRIERGPINHAVCKYCRAARWCTEAS